MEGAFNDASFALMRGASEPEVIAAIDRVLAQYGSLGAVSRANQLSNWFIENELTQLQTMGFIIPAIFLGVSAFLLNIVLTRLIAVQREQIAALKALGYTNREIGVHYVSWALAIALTGAVLGGAGGVWLGNAMTTLYNDFFRFPTLQLRACAGHHHRGRAHQSVGGRAGRDWRRDARSCGFHLPKPCGRNHQPDMSSAGSTASFRAGWLRRL